MEEIKMLKKRLVSLIIIAAVVATAVMLYTEPSAMAQSDKLPTILVKDSNTFVMAVTILSSVILL